MAIIDVKAAAASLRVVDVWRPGNPSGVVTHFSMYWTAGAKPYDRFVRHVTVGTNSLAYLARNDRLACIPYLVPTKASDMFPDNWTVFKMIPDEARAYHVGDMEWRGETEAVWHPRSMGHEIENRGDFAHEIEQRQYIKSALLYAHDCALYKWQDTMVFDHATIAIPHGRRTDPQAGLFRESIWWDYITQIRSNWPWTDVPVWYGGNAF